MLAFLQNNFATIIILIALAFLVFLAIRKIVRDKKKGIGSCGQSCADCPKYNNCDQKRL